MRKIVGRSLSTNGAIYATPSLSIVHRYQITSPSAARIPNNPASAAAIACAVVYIFPRPAVVVCMALLCALIGGLRVLSGQHDLSDVLAALALSLALSLAGYLL